MSQPVKLQAIYRGASPRVDRTFKLSFDTQELTGEQLADLHKVYMTECWISVSADGQTEAAALPEYKPTKPFTKSRSQALRNEIRMYHQVSGLAGTPDEFYDAEMQVYIQHWHDKVLETQS